MKLAVSPAAAAELRAARLWYEEQRGGLGDALVFEIEEAIARAIETPASFPLVPGSVRFRAVRVYRFPYAVVYC